MNCPACGSGAYTDGACATCRYRAGTVALGRVLDKRKEKREAERLKKKQRACPHGEWEFIEYRWQGHERTTAEKCKRCGVERQVAA